MTEEKELNEKLARWAGVEPIKRDWQRTTVKCSEGKLSEDGYSLPCDIETYTELEYPDFTTSLDACFKWLVPKLGEDYWIIVDPPKGKVIIVLGFVEEAKGVAETSALSLCRAIEKLIDGH